VKTAGYTQKATSTENTIEPVALNQLLVVNGDGDFLFEILT